MLGVALFVVAVVGGVTAWAVTTGGGSSSSVNDAENRTVFRSVVAVGEQAPRFELRGLDGKRVSLAAYQGRPVVLTFWASWCQPCRREFPLLSDARKRFAKDGLEVIGITYQDIPSDSRDFAREMQASWPLAADASGDVASAYGVRAIPLTFFVDRDGFVASRVFGLHSADELDENITKMLEG